MLSNFFANTAPKQTTIKYGAILTDSVIREKNNKTKMLVKYIYLSPQSMYLLCCGTTIYVYLTNSRKNYNTHWAAEFTKNTNVPGHIVNVDDYITIQAHNIKANIIFLTIDTKTIDEWLLLLPHDIIFTDKLKINANLFETIETLYQLNIIC